MHQLRLGDDAVADVGDAVRARQRGRAAARASPRAAADRRARPGSRNFALSTPRSQARPVGPSAACISSSVATCASVSIISTPGISGVAGKVPLEEVLVDRDVLDRHDAPARLVLGDRVDQRRRIAVARGARWTCGMFNDARVRDDPGHGLLLDRQRRERPVFGLPRRAA